MLQDEILKTVGSILGMITTVVGAVVGVALLVGGIGIMNIMLVSVTERTREIGIRKAVGARRQDVLVQFMIEAITLSLVGGGIGLAAGWGLGALVATLLPGDWPPAHVPFWAILLAVGFSAVVGIFFGIYPAGKASQTRSDRRVAVRVAAPAPPGGALPKSSRIRPMATKLDAVVEENRTPCDRRVPLIWLIRATRVRTSVDRTRIFVRNAWPAGLR